MFGFKKQNRENYDRTFLRKVFLTIEYPQINTLKEQSEQLKVLFTDIFPRFTLGKDMNYQLSFGNNVNTDLKSLGENDNILFRSLNGKKQLNISCDRLMLSIEGDDYRSYESSIKGITELIKKYFDLAGINTIFNISIRKINLIEFGYSDNDYPNGILSTLLNENIILSDVSFPDISKITMNIHNIDFKEDEYSLNLKYGMNTLDKGVGQLLVDLNLIYRDTLTVDKMDAEFEVINSEIYDAFYWIFNDTAKKMLKDG